MKKSLPPLTWFRAFDAAARHQSFTAAAGELGLTQSAVSQHIRALETRLGAALFIRKPKGLALTDAGRLLVPDVAAAMVRLRAATDAFLLDDHRETLTVAASVSVAQWIIAPGLRSFQTAHPNVNLRITTTIWPDDFTAAMADVEIRFGTFDVVGGNAALIGGQRVVAVAAPALLRHGPWQTHPLIQPVGVYNRWPKVFAALGISPAPEASVFVDSHGLAVDMAVSGGGVALTNSLIAAPALSDGRLVEVAIDGARPKEAYYIAVTPGHASEAFASWLQKRITDQSPAG